jgi:hypothetical protein
VGRAVSIIPHVTFETAIVSSLLYQGLPGADLPLLETAETAGISPPKLPPLQDLGSRFAVSS